MADFSPGQIVTIFRSRLRAESLDSYNETSNRMTELAATMPGLVDYKSFVSDDGERVTIVTFSDEETQKAWRQHLEHAQAQSRGRSDFYEEYTLQVGQTVRARSFKRAPSAE